MTPAASLSRCRVWSSALFKGYPFNPLVPLVPPKLSNT